MEQPTWYSLGYAVVVPVQNSYVHSSSQYLVYQEACSLYRYIFVHQWQKFFIRDSAEIFNLAEDLGKAHLLFLDLQSVSP